MTSQATLTPTGHNERISSMDIIRGVSVCGILLMNITGFGLWSSYEDPTVMGGSTGWNLKVWWINSLLFEGTMRGMFSMLFGAGILLFTGRSADGDSGVVTDLFFRRLMWMVLFGIIHCYLLLWNGEILYCYAIVGMFAFSFRHLAPKKLIVGATVLVILATLWNVSDYYNNKNAYEAAQVKEDKKAIEAWSEIVSSRKPGKEKINEEVAARHKDYWSIVMHKVGENQYMQTLFLYRYNFLDTLSMMLLGMAFLKLGILKAIRSNRFYWIMMLIGYSVGLAVNYYETDMIVSDSFSILSFDKSSITYNVGRIAMTLGHIAIIMLFIKSGWLAFLQKSLASVGQMAFTSYITQSIICNIIFLGYGFSLFGKLQRYELYYVVFGVWIFQLIVSPIWLRYFRFGPLEWVWRSLTYWQLQPFRKVRQ